MAFAGSSGRTRDGRAHGERESSERHADERQHAGERARTTGPRTAATSADAEHTQAWRAGAGGSAARPQRGAHEEAEAPPATRPRGRAFARSLDVDVDWPRAGTFGAGLAVGALLGASVALLLAPASGPSTRRRLGRVSRRAGLRAADAWADLGEELRHATYRTRRKIRRRVGQDDSLFGLRRRKEAREEHEAPPRGRRRTPWSRGEPDTVAVEL